MKGYRKYIFYVAVAALVTFVYRDWRHKNKISDEGPIAVFDIHQMNEISIQSNQDESQFKIIKPQNSWRIAVGDSSYVTDAGKISSLLQILNGSGLSELNDSEIEFNPQLFLIKLSGDKMNWAWEVAGQTTFNGNDYVRKVGSEKLYYTKASWQSILSRGWKYFVSLNIIAELRGLSQITVKSELHNYSMSKSSGAWSLLSDKAVKLNNRQVAKLLLKLQNLAAENFVLKTSESYKNSILKQPIEFEISLSSNQIENLLTFRKFNKRIYVDSSQRGVVLVMPESIVNEMHVSKEFFVKEDANENSK